MSLLMYFKDPLITKLRAQQKPEYPSVELGSKIYIPKLEKYLIICDAIWGMDGTSQWFYRLNHKDDDWFSESELPIINGEIVSKKGIEWIILWARRHNIPLPFWV